MARGRTGERAGDRAGEDDAPRISRRLVARTLLRAAMRRVERLAEPPLTFALAVPERIVLAPPDILPGSAEAAEAIYGGRFDLADHLVETGGASPFAAIDVTPAWSRALHGFGWLRHAGAQGDALARAHARALAGDWFREHGHPAPGIAWEPVVASARLRHWLAHSLVLLAPATPVGATLDDATSDTAVPEDGPPNAVQGPADLVDPGFDDRFMRQIAVHRRFLKRAARDTRDPLVRLHALATLAIASLALPTRRQEQRRLGASLDAELAAQMLHDGGHVSRRAAAGVDLLTALMPLARCYVARGLVAPPGLLPTIDRMVPALRHHVMGDGGLARHNGTYGVRRDRLDAVLSLSATGEATAPEPDATPDTVPALGLGSAAGAGASRGVDEDGAPLELPDSGYQRLAMGGTVLVADTGTLPPAPHAAHAHAGALSFEMSVGDAPLIVNLGGVEPDGHGTETGAGDLARALRSTAAHSTLSLSNVASARIVPGATARRLFGAVMVDGPTRVELRRADAGDATWRGFRAVHDGYRGRRGGISHERVLMLKEGGALLEGTDRMTRTDPTTRTDGAAETEMPEAHLRFHLHPAVHVTMETGGAVTLEAGDQRWRFVADVTPTLEETLFCDGRPVASTQIVLALGGARGGAEWSFTRVDAMGTAKN